MFSQLLLQVTYLFFPLVLYFALLKFNDSLDKYYSIYVGIFCGLSIYLCMAFPITIGTGNMMDLRMVPWMLAFLYGGFPTGIAVTLFLFLLRLYHGGLGIYVVLSAYPIIIFFLFLLIRDYNHLSYRMKIKRVMCTMFIGIVSVLISIHIIFGFADKEVLIFHLFFAVLHLVMIWICVYLIETLLEKEQLQKQIAKAEKLNIVGQMAASVAHEIRNPLTVVSGFMQLMKQDHDISKQHQEHIKIMMSELKRAEIIIEDYLTLAKPEFENMTAINITEQLEQIIQTITFYAYMKSVEISFIHDGSVPIVSGSVKKTQQVFVNVLKNAVEASPQSGKIEVSMFTDEKFCYIKVLDQGGGLTPQEIERLGTPFYSTKEKGTGLGLTLTYSIVKSMGGQIDVESKKEIGTTFTIKLVKKDGV